jgi:hypothetical protein
MLAKAIANECNANFISIKVSEVVCVRSEIWTNRILGSWTFDYVVWWIRGQRTWRFW